MTFLFALLFNSQPNFSRLRTPSHQNKTAPKKVLPSKSTAKSVVPQAISTTSPMAYPITLPPSRNRFENTYPLPGAPSITVDRFLDGDSLASSVARNRNLQSRVMWVDGTANLDKMNTDGKVIFWVDKIKDSGFNTIVYDVKPISGQTIYPSHYAPKITDWRGQTMPEDFDPLKIMAAECKLKHISLLVSMNAFSEGHQMFQVGPGYQLPDEQSVLYEPKITIHGFDSQSFPCSSQVNVMPDGASEIGVFNDTSLLPKFPIPDSFAVSLLPGHKVLDGFEGGGIGKGVPAVPKGGAILIGTGTAANFLRHAAVPGETIQYLVAPYLVPIGQRPKREIPLMMNPSDYRVQDRILAMVRELANNYPIDGIVFDDRLRYAGLDADFSETTHQLFEKFVHNKVTWPEGVYSYSMTTDFQRGIVPGPYWDAWLEFRALTIRNFLARVRDTLNYIRPGLQLGDYSGSWFGEYWALGSNWSSKDFDAGFYTQTPIYSKTGFANLLDFLITGCYYHTGTVHEALATNQPIGQTVEAAGAFTNRAVNDQCWSIAGISADGFQDDPNRLMNVLSAACATTQGVMVFDLSYITDPMWDVFKRAFSIPRLPVGGAQQSLNMIRSQKASNDAAMKKKGESQPPVIIIAGSSGAGQ